MSVVRSPRPDRPDLGEKVLLPRFPPAMWKTLEREWAGDDQARWKALCALHLYVYCQWTMEMIGWAFGHTKGRVCHILKEVKQELAGRFVPETEEAAERARRLDDGP